MQGDGAEVPSDTFAEAKGRSSYKSLMISFVYCEASGASGSLRAVVERLGKVRRGQVGESWHVAEASAGATCEGA